MNKTSGLLLDLQDDTEGASLRTFFPTLETIPESIKTAHALSFEERSRLPDDDFALVLLDEGQKIRKYACVDEGNTQLSVLYFMANGYKLPAEAQKVAAANLVTACGWYDLDVPPALEKVAFGMATITKGLGLMSLPATIQGTHSQIKQNLSNVRAGEAQGASVVTPHEMKMAEMTGTSLMPLQAPGNLEAKSTKIPPIKTAGSLGRLVPGHSGEQENFGPEEGRKYDGYTKGEQYKALAQMVPLIDVSSKEAPAYTKEKKASFYALADQYPLDSYVQVKEASRYFEEYYKHMDPEDRHNYCVNLVKRAEALDITTSDLVQKYGSEEYAPLVEIKVAFDARKGLLLDDVHILVLKELEEKQGSIQVDSFCAALEEFDKIAGLTEYYDSYLADPYYSTYGVKLAEEYSFIDGNDLVTEEDLKRFSATRRKSIVHSFGDDFAKEFKKDPIAIFKSLPLQQKKMLIHLATDNAPGAEIVP